MSPYELSCAAKAGLLFSTVIREFMSVNTENAVLAFGRFGKPSEDDLPYTGRLRVGSAGNKVATSAHNRKEARSLRPFSSVSILGRENNRIPVGSQSCERSAIKWPFLLTKVGSCRRIFAAPSLGGNA